MSQNKENPNKPEKGVLPKYGLGFEIIVFLGVTVIAINGALPLGVFGIVFGKFLASIADETTATSLSNCVLNAALFFTGIFSNFLLKKWNCRNVALLGAILGAVGSFAIILVKDLTMFIVFFGIFEGFALGLLLSASITALQNTFEGKKLALMLSLSQAVMVGCCSVMPIAAHAAMVYLGYRGSVICLGVLSALCIPAALTLTPFSCCEPDKKGYNESQKHIEALLELEHYYPRDNVKVITVGNRSYSVTNLNSYGSSSFWTSISSSTEISLLKSSKYMNICLGIALAYTSDVCFIPLIPVVLNEKGFTQSEVAQTMSIFFGCDMAARILHSIISGLFFVRSKYWVLFSTCFTVIFRIGFTFCESYTGKVTTLAAMGFLRSFMQTPFPLVISEEYPDHFATAFSLFMVLAGIVFVGFGPVMGFVKSVTGSNDMVCHLLTMCNVICAVTWLLEMVFAFFQNERNGQKLTRNNNNKV